MSVHQAQANFINARQFAVIGRVLTDRTRWDNKVLRWYQAHSLAVTPVLPSGASSSAKEVEGLQVCSDPTTLPDLSNTSISIIINPSIGLDLLKTLYPSDGQGGARTTRSTTAAAAARGPKGIWFQPGAESPEIIQYIKSNGLEGRVVWGGPCILEDGEEVLKLRHNTSASARI